MHLETEHKNLWLMNDCFTTVFVHLYAYYIDSNGHFEVLNRSKSYFVQKLWLKIQIFLFPLFLEFCKKHLLVFFFFFSCGFLLSFVIVSFLLNPHCNPLQGNYRVELLHREIPVVITGNGFVVHVDLFFLRQGGVVPSWWCHSVSCQSSEAVARVILYIKRPDQKWSISEV